MASTNKIEPRTEQFIEALGKLEREGKLPSNIELAAILGIKSKSTLSDIKAKRVNIQPDKWELFQKHFKLGEYEGEENSTGEEESTYKAVKPKPYRQPKTEDNPELDGIIFVPISAQAGYAKSYMDPIFKKQLQRIFIPGIPYRGDRYRYFEVDGDSMEPTFKHGYHVLTEIIEQSDYQNIANFYVYVIVIDDKIMLKRLYKKNEMELVAISDNEEYYDQFIINVTDIKELWVVKRKIDWEMSPPRKFEIKI